MNYMMCYKRLGIFDSDLYTISLPHGLKVTLTMQTKQYLVGHAIEYYNKSNDSLANCKCSETVMI